MNSLNEIEHPKQVFKLMVKEIIGHTNSSMQASRYKCVSEQIFFLFLDNGAQKNCMFNLLISVLVCVLF